MFQQIEVENFKSLKHVKYDCARLNLLTGLNGSGKSSFIQLLLFLRQAAIASPDGLRKPNITVHLNDGVLNFGQQRDLFYRSHETRTELIDIRLRMKAPWGEGGPFEMHKVIRPIDSDTSKRTVGLEHPDFSAIDSEARARFGKAIQDEASEAEFDAIEEDYNRKYNSLIPSEGAWSRGCARMMDDLRYISAFRLRPTPTHRISNHADYRGGNQAQPFDPEGEFVAEYLENVGEGFEVLPPLLHCATKERGLHTQLNAWLGIVSPGAELSLKRIEEVDQVVMSVGFKGDESQYFKPQNVGTGISNVINVLTALLTVRKGDCIVIENPELHLHPRGQAEIGKLIARAVAAGAQIFVETHSDHVINGIRVAVKNGIVDPRDVKIAFFRRAAHDVYGNTVAPTTEYYSEVETIKIDANGSLSNYPVDFMDEWNNQLMELLK